MQRVSSQLLLLVMLHLVLVLVDGAYFYHQMDSTRDDARIINATGVIRGSMQRLVKLELLGEDTANLRRDIGELLTSFENGKSGYVLGLDSDRFGEAVAALRQSWDRLGKVLDAYHRNPGDEARLLLLRASEDAWEKADQTVFTAQAISERKWGRNMFGMGLLLLNLPLLGAIFWVVRNLVRGRLEYGAAHDALTGVFNRFNYERLVQGQIAASERHGRPFGFLVLDLDHFKRVNDRHGHTEGDKVLRAVAHEVQDNLRASDLLFRIGGEEFVVVLPETDLARAETVAEKIRSRVELLDMECGEAMTVSLGVTEYRGGDTLESLFARADGRLLEAKKQGRNRFLSA